MRTNPLDSGYLAIGQMYVNDMLMFGELPATPTPPPLNKGLLYALNDGGVASLYWEDSNGDEYKLAGGGVGPAPADGPFILWEPNVGLTNSISVGDSPQALPVTTITFLFEPSVSGPQEVIVRLTEDAAQTSTVSIGASYDDGSDNSVDLRMTLGDANVTLYANSFNSNFFEFSSANPVNNATMYLNLGQTPAQSGIFRLPNATNIAWRNGTNAADILFGPGADNVVDLVISASGATGIVNTTGLYIDKAGSEHYLSMSVQDYAGLAFYDATGGKAFFYWADINGTFEMFTTSVMLIFGGAFIRIPGNSANTGVYRMRNYDGLAWRNAGNTDNGILSYNPDGRFEFDSDLATTTLLLVGGLPNADPGVPGVLYHTAGTVMISL